LGKQKGEMLRRPQRFAKGWDGFCVCGVLRYLRLDSSTGAPLPKG